MSAPNAAARKAGDQVRDISDPGGATDYVKIGENAWVRVGDLPVGTASVPVVEDAFIDERMTSPVTAEAAVALLRRIREISGLSYHQIGRALGVSTRTVHYWLTSGTPKSQRMIGHIVNVHAIINFLDGGTPEERRKQLLYSSNGRSILHQLTLEAPQNQQLYFSALTVRDRLGAS